MTKETTTRLEEKGMSQRSEDLLQVYKTLTFDLPLVSLRWAFGSANDKESTIAVWKGYDAGVRLATSTIDSLYRSQSLSEIVGNTVNQMLRVQQLSNAASSFFATSLWRPLALPATSDAQTLAAPVQALDTRLSEDNASTNASTSAPPFSETKNSHPGTCTDTNISASSSRRWPADCCLAVLSVDLFQANICISTATCAPVENR